MDSLAKTRDCHENHAMLRFLSNDEKSFSCHIERSEVSLKNILQAQQKTEIFRLFQSLNMTNTLSLRASVSERGNLNGVASDLQNSQLAIQGDCHESVCTDSRNDEKSTKSKFNSRQIPKKICRFFTLFCRFFFFFGVGILEKLALKNTLIVAIFGIFCYFFTFFCKIF